MSLSFLFDKISSKLGLTWPPFCGDKILTETDRRAHSISIISME